MKAEVLTTSESESDPPKYGPRKASDLVSKLASVTRYYTDFLYYDPLGERTPSTTYRDAQPAVHERAIDYAFDLYQNGNPEIAEPDARRRREVVRKLGHWLQPGKVQYSSAEDDGLPASRPEADELIKKIVAGFAEEYLRKNGMRNKFIVKIRNKGGTRGRAQFFDVLGTDDNPNLDEDAMNQFLSDLEKTDTPENNDETIAERLDRFVEIFGIDAPGDDKIMRRGKYSGDPIKYQKVAIILRHMFINHARIRNGERRASAAFPAHDVTKSMELLTQKLRGKGEALSEDDEALMMKHVTACLLQFDGFETPVVTTKSGVFV